ncbi:MAG: two-component system, cell cycle sensor histidine kinase and response regulator CckA [Chthoniobacter sp.]|jgi:CheY-like chemotaxis protein|nr:two-component system, cell cycle sensor histidine kinase and response regulator CckA [Chthoniobacter sp.]
MFAQIPTILLAEDEPLIRRAIQATLVDMGFVVRPARDGDEGCALIDAMKDQCPQLLVTDVEMPGCSGEELAQHARQCCAQIKLLFTSGTPQPALRKSIAADPNARFLEKPFLPGKLREVIREMGVGPPASL